MFWSVTIFSVNYGDADTCNITYSVHVYNGCAVKMVAISPFLTRSVCMIHVLAFDEISYNFIIR